ncbi:helix-turn-helix domain-containing protein [Nocardia sp. NPDC060256]|uniref:helix-turn-helix domain-containing protein n=1 Tax=unclassified Nocardia TaxID=2637762 RepID=UPI00364F7958
MGSSATPTVYDIRSTAAVSARDAFEQWEAALAENYAPLAVSPVGEGEFRGRIVVNTFQNLEVSDVRTTGQRLRRSRRLLERPDDPHLVVAFSEEGGGWLTQNGHTCAITHGGMFCWDTVRPLTAQFDPAIRMLVIRVPLAELLAHTTLSLDRLPTAVRFPAEGAAAVVGQFFRGVAPLQLDDPGGAAALAEHGTGLLASMMSLSAGVTPSGPPAQTLTKQTVLAFIHRNYTNPELTAEQIAHACMMSRRSLYRLFEDTEHGIGTRLLRMRLDHARKLLRTQPSRSLASVAAASGFASERHFYRAFKQATGMTPGEFRAREMRPTPK